MDDEFGVPPEYVKNIMKSGKKHPEDNFGPEDVNWQGKDGKSDPDRILSEHGHDPVSPLAWILSAIIKAHPVQDQKKNSNMRLKTALTALTGIKKLGRNPVDDSDLLLEIGWRYHCEYYGKGWGPVKPELRPIVKAVVKELAPERHEKRNIDDHSLIEKLEDKFNKDKDVWATRAVADNDYDRMNIVRATCLVIEQLNKLGIAADKSVVKANTRLPSSASSFTDETS